MSGRPRRLGVVATMGWVSAAIVVAAAGGDSTFVAVGMSTLMVGYDWGPDPEVGYNDKVALMAGDFEALVSIPSDTPPDGQVRW